jgi:hypothetical protein
MIAMRSEWDFVLRLDGYARRIGRQWTLYVTPQKAVWEWEVWKHGECVASGAFQPNHLAAKRAATRACNRLRGRRG